MAAETEGELKHNEKEDPALDGVDDMERKEERNDDVTVETDNGGCGDDAGEGGNASAEAEVTETEDDFKHQPLFVCCCGASFQFLGQITSHKKKSCEWIYVCPHCDRVYKDFDKMTAHKETHNTTVIPTPALLGIPLASEKATPVPVNPVPANSDPAVSNNVEDKKSGKDESAAAPTAGKEGSGKEEAKNVNKITTVTAAPKKKLVITPPVVRPPRPNMALANRPNFMANQGMMNQPFMGNFNQGMINPQMSMGMGMMNPQMGLGMMNPQMGMGNFNMNPMMGNCMPNQGGFFPNNMGMNNMMGPNMMGMNMGMMGGNFGPNMGGIGPNMGVNQNMNMGPNQGSMPHNMGPNHGPVSQNMVPNQGLMSKNMGSNQGPMPQGPSNGPPSHHKVERIGPGRDAPGRIGLGRVEPSRIGLGREEPGRIGLGREEPGRMRSLSPRRRTRSPSSTSRSPSRRDREYDRDPHDWPGYKDKDRFLNDRDDSRDRFDRKYDDRDRPSPWERSLTREEFLGTSRDLYRDDSYPKNETPFSKSDNLFRNFSPRDDGPPGLAKLGFGLKRDNPDLPKHPSKMMRPDSRY